MLGQRAIKSTSLSWDNFHAIVKPEALHELHLGALASLPARRLGKEHAGRDASAPRLRLDSHPSSLARSLSGALGEGIAEFVARFFGFGFEPLDQVGMLRCDIGGFADVVDEIVKFCLFQL